MKKTLLAVAVAAALPVAAFAQTNVTLSGMVKGGLAFTKLDDAPNNGPKGGNATSLDDGSSRFIISGTEDLGGGMRGIFQVDTRFRVEEGGGTLASGNTFVGLAGNWGAFRLGRLDTYYHLGTDEFGARSTALQAASISLVSYIGSSAIAGTTRINNVLRYDLPAMSGFGGGLTYSSNPMGNDGTTVDVPGGNERSKGQAWSADLGYGSGPFKVGAAYWDYKAEGNGSGFAGDPASGAGQKAWRLYGSWDFGVAKVGLLYDQSKLLGGSGGVDTKRGAWSIPVTAKLGPGTALFTYSQTRDVDVTGGVGKIADSGAKMYALGYDYPLSKRTSLGVSYAVINNENNANYMMFTSVPLGGHTPPAAGQDQKQLYLGIKHNF